MVLGALFAILSSLSFALNTIAIRRGVLAGSALSGITISVIIGVPLLAIAAAITGQIAGFARLTTQAWLLLVAAGLSHFLIGRYANYRVVGALGATRAGPIRELALPVSLLIAVFTLHEQVTWAKGLGIVMIMAGSAIVFERSASNRRSEGPPRPVAGAQEAVAAPRTAVATTTKAPARPAPPPVRLAEGYFFGLLAAGVYGTTPPIIRAAIGGTGLGILGSLVSYAAAAGVLALSLAFPGRLKSMRAMSPQAARWFLYAGFTVFFAQMFRYVALDFAPVTVVSPLQQTGALFTLFLSFLFNRHLESFKPRVLAGIALAVAGSILVVS